MDAKQEGQALQGAILAAGRRGNIQALAIPRPPTVKPEALRKSAPDHLIHDLEASIKSLNGGSRNPLERIADQVVTALSTPAAIWVQSAAIAGYVAFNTMVVFKVLQFDPYPFLFLNTIFSLISAYTTVFVLNSNRRQDAAAKAMEQAELKIYRKILLDLDSIKRGGNNAP